VRLNRNTNLAVQNSYDVGCDSLLEKAFFSDVGVFFSQADMTLGAK
jgi:hypothetical protein